MKKICVLTATRAEYGLLSRLIKKMMDDPAFDVRVVVTGMHLSPEFGSTWKEIEADGVHIDRKIEMLLSSDTPAAISKSMGVALMGFADYFNEINPDALMVLGDRYETLAVCIAAMNERIPIFHIHGGEATEGLIDEAIRHSITKMSILHFTSTDTYQKRVIQLGESPDRVFNVGSLGVENAVQIELLTRRELAKHLSINLDGKYAVGTFHPVTLEHDTAKNQIRELLKAIDENNELTYIFTKANADQNGRIINKLLGEYAERHDNFYLVDSLGMKNYLSAVKYSEFVIGNSSSGLIEVPSFNVPSIDIGERQKGRVHGETVIHCNPEKKEINDSIKKALCPDFISKIKCQKNPYDAGNTSDRIIKVLQERFIQGGLGINKHFYDISFTY